jgi:hypothetical protein
MYFFEEKTHTCVSTKLRAGARPQRAPLRSLSLKALFEFESEDFFEFESEDFFEREKTCLYMQSNKRMRAVR